MNEDYIRTPSALTLWTLGTGFLGGIASWTLSKRAEKEGWTKFKIGYVIAAIVVASGLNLWLASKIQGEK